MRTIAKMKLFLYRPLDPVASCPVGPMSESLIRSSRLFEITDNPDDCDWLLVPYWIQRLTDGRQYARAAGWIRSLGYYRSRENKHIFFCSSDSSHRICNEPVFFRCSFNRFLSNCCAIPYESSHCWALKELSSGPVEDCSFDCSFVGFGYPLVRRVAAESLALAMVGRSFVEIRRKYFWHYTPASRAGGYKQYVDVIRRSLTVFCPRGAGYGSQRLFEVMAAGRCPVVMAHEYTFPFAERSRWEEFCLIVPDGVIGGSGEWIKEQIDTLGRDRLLDMGRKAKEFYLSELADEHWPRQIHKILSRRMVNASSPGQ